MFLKNISMNKPGKYQKLIKLARQLLNGVPSRQKHFSFLIIRNKVVSFGFNYSFKTHPLAKKYGHRFSSTHSELKALADFPFRTSKLSDCKLINIRIMANGSLGMSKPCNHCQVMLRDYGIKVIVYTDWRGKFQYLNL